MDPLLERINVLERRTKSLQNSLRCMRRSRDYWRDLAGAKPHGSSTTWHRKPGRKRKAAA